MDRRYVLVSVLVSVLFICCNAFAQDEEEITLITYYPAPLGEYDELRVSGNTYLAVDSGGVGIGTDTPGAILDIVGDGEAILIPRKSTAGDPAAGIEGMIYYNSNSNKFRIYQNGSWQDMQSAAPGLPADTSKTIRGSVDRDGLILAGSGFSIQYSPVGQFRINFNTAFGSQPSIVATYRSKSPPGHTGPKAMINRPATTTYCDIVVVDHSGGVFYYGGFEFIAIGPE